MNLLVIDSDGTGLDICYRASEAGHKVRWWMKKEKGKIPKDGDGFPVEKVDSWKAHMNWAKSGLIVNLYNDKDIVPQLDR